MAIQGMSFLVRMFHEIILHPHIYFVLSVTLYCVIISLLHNCCLLRPAMMALYSAFNSPVNTNLNVRNATQSAFILHTLKSKWINTYRKHVARKPPNVLHNTEGALYRSNLDPY